MEWAGRWKYVVKEYMVWEKRPRGRPWKRWKDNVEELLEEIGVRLGAGIR